MKRAKLLIKHAEQIVQVCANNEDMLVGEAMKNIAVMKPEEGTSGLSLVIDRCNALYRAAFLILSIPFCLSFYELMLACSDRQYVFSCSFESLNNDI